MHATVMYDAGDVWIENVPDAHLIEPTDAVVRVTRAGICGSDLHPYHQRERGETGTRMSHEAVGSQVTKINAISAYGLLFASRTLSGSIIGGIAQTQEMLDFCGHHNITSDVEVIPIQKVNEAYARLEKSDVKYRFSIDMASMKA